ncbi:hypothetical protein WMZ97_20735 [Lentibacillus sp. N15]|uniref:hypothetical protein n=1 Tax=Lentibacillus songyuanensis TaxID=3136161 RepID=UPI0031BB31D2
MMGLDMYLFSAPRIKDMKLEEILSVNLKLADLRKENNETFLAIKDYIKHFEFYGHKWESLLTEEMYWRKANHIHSWFVQHIQNGIDDNGAMSEVTLEQLEELYRSCRLVLRDHSKAMDILPRMAGPYFGDLSYNFLYLDQVKQTSDKLEQLMQPEFLDKNYLLYQSSW